MRMPPSHVVPFLPRSGSFRDVLSAVGPPLSLRKNTSVDSSSPASWSLPRTAPTASSMAESMRGERPPPRVVNLREAVAIFGRRLQRAMHGVKGEIQEKGLSTVPIGTVSIDTVTIDTVTTTVTINTVTLTVTINTVAIDKAERFAAEGVGEVLGLLHVLGAAEDFAAAPSVRDVDVQPAEEAEELVKARARSAGNPPRAQVPFADEAGRRSRPP